MDREQFMEDIFMAFSITFPVANEKCKKISEKQLLESLPPNLILGRSDLEDENFLNGLASLDFNLM